MAKIHRDPSPYIHNAGTEEREEKMSAAPAEREQYQENSENEQEIQQDTPKKSSRGQWLYTAAIIFFAGVFLLSAAMLIKRYVEDRRAENAFSDLAALAEKPAAVSDKNTEIQQTDDGSDIGNAERFSALVQKNPDFIGWISIEGTNLDFPVMHKPDVKDFYLRHDFDGAYSNYGVPYLDEDCTLSETQRSENLIIYGHNMKTGTIFGCLTDYKKADTYSKHPVIQFDTLYDSGTYEVFAAFAIDVVEDQSFDYYNKIDMDEDQYNDFVAEVKRRSDVDSGITPVYGEDLLTLSTCEYSTANGRYVVCARRC